MPVDLIVAFGAIALLAVLVGVVVKGLLAASSQASAMNDDVMARAAHVGDTHLPEFIASRMRARRAVKVRASWLCPCRASHLGTPEPSHAPSLPNPPGTLLLPPHQISKLSPTQGSSCQLPSRDHLLKSYQQTHHTLS